VNITYRPTNLLTEATDALIVPVFATDGDVRDSGLVLQLDDQLGGGLTQQIEDERFTGKCGSTLVVPSFGRTAARRIILVGLGSTDDLVSDDLRRAYAAAVLAARRAGAAKLLAGLPPATADLGEDAILEAAAEGATLATYRFTKYVGQARAKDAPSREIETLTFTGDLDQSDAQQALDRAAAISAAVNLARDLVNEPANALNPEGLAEHARRIAEEHHLKIEVLGPEDMNRLGMGAIAAVGRGSASEPRLIHLVYRPKNAAANTRQLGFVGKGITFDTGGYSIKTHAGMLTMKVDMAGAAAVLGAMSALRAVNCPHIVHGVICAAENMISSTAFRPGDVLTASNGVTIEIISTDAEGRLVLADGLVYAARQGAQELIDLATLTGAAVVALGEGTSALFSNDDALAARLEQAAEEAGEDVWRMPLTESLEAQIKGDVGDIKNSGGRPGGAITAALFLQHFTEGLPWAHFDIAGTANTRKVSGYTPKGATGVGVRTLINYAREA
jgi:leucyl aminopeptidase